MRRLVPWLVLVAAAANQNPAWPDTTDGIHLFSLWDSHDTDAFNSSAASPGNVSQLDFVVRSCHFLRSSPLTMPGDQLVSRIPNCPPDLWTLT